MRYQICAPGFPLDSWLIPPGTLIDYSSGDMWSTLIRERGLPPPINAACLDGESYWAQQRAYPYDKHLLGGLDPQWIAEVTTALKRIPPDHFRGQFAKFYEFMISSKHVGISLANFISWWGSSPQDADEIAKHWKSVDPKWSGAFFGELARRGIKLGERDGNAST